MCSCNKNKSIKPEQNNQKSFVAANKVSTANSNAKKTREELLAELRRRIANATR